MTTDPSHVSSSEMDTSWAGLLQNHRLCTEKDHNPAKSPLKRTEHELQDSVAADVRALVSQSATSGSTKAGLQNSKASGVTIKQEVCEENEHLERKEMPKSGSVKPHRPSSEAHRQNHISHKATVQDVLKLHSRVGTGLKLQAAIQHLHRPMKNPPHVLSNSTTAALSIAHTQVVNLNPLNRIPSSSKAAPPPPLPAPRVHLGDKQPAALNRPGAPWARSQHQSANSHHADPVPHADSHSGPRHLLRCGQCGKCFPHPSNLKAHLQTHTGERPFCCSLCDRSFTKLSNLKAHRRVHTGERPYCCLACGKRFTQKCNLKRHQRIHLDM
ncbi:putative GDNF-inducible zinc finger protein 1-like [Scophthalmus maximus]|uniref:Putative GDNF-inducible zinc finger protein 1-like n=1 Tax=Scophthalmus maximus TaxID=52904 RepID=A0A2U9BQS9_SCOMX|nr:putative GDNF-inducible zinc finger protein 1-like [Scophthalmus maximus]